MGVQPVMSILNIGRRELPVAPAHRLGIVLAPRVVVQDVHAVGRVDVVPVRPEPRGAVEFLPIEDTRRVWIGTLSSAWHLLKLSPAPQMALVSFGLGRLVARFVACVRTCEVNVTMHRWGTSCLPFRLAPSWSMLAT